MSTAEPTDLAGFAAAAEEHLERLMGSWGVFADFSFSDLLLYAPISGDDAPVDDESHGGVTSFEIVGQMRPATSQTLFPSDRVGEVATGETLVEDTFSSGSLASDEVVGQGEEGLLRREAIPVGFEGSVIAVLLRVWSPRVGRRVGGLELVYRRISEQLAAMVAAGLFPFHTAAAAVEDAPRVGDGVIVLTEEARISFASPNAVNALHRLGSASSIVGAKLDELGVDTRTVREAFAERIPVIEEFERPPDLRVIFHCIPMIDGEEVAGAAVMLRDVTDLRRRDRLLLSKDAAMREIHHRVKNNLQTISSLLRLQSRRLGPGRAQLALEEAERRIRSIAVVHDVLSREPGEVVTFAEIVPRLVELVQDAGAGADPVRVAVQGDIGDLSADVAMPLALVIAELLQNACEHGRPDGGQPLEVELVLARSPEDLEVSVRDNGVGFPAGFHIDTTSGLGLSIVRDLVRAQLSGAIEAKNDGGAVVSLWIPLGEDS